jgi:hypothetical protein
MKWHWHGMHERPRGEGGQKRLPVHLNHQIRTLMCVKQGFYRLFISYFSIFIFYSLCLLTGGAIFVTKKNVFSHR